MLLDQASSCLLLVDIQQKLAPYILNSKAVIQRCAWVLGLANELQIPILGCEQYPQGLGQTMPELRSYLSQPCIPKVQFSCLREPAFSAKVHGLTRKQMIIIGIETHVCVLQTAFDLRASGFEVYVVADAVGSRYEIDHRFGLQRMQAQGINIITAEMLFFEWLKQAGTPEFKRLSKSFFEVKNAN